MPESKTKMLREAVLLCLLGGALGLLAAHFRLLDSGLAVTALGIVIAVLIAVGIHASMQLWDDADD